MLMHKLEEDSVDEEYLELIAAESYGEESSESESESKEGAAAIATKANFIRKSNDYKLRAKHDAFLLSLEEPYREIFKKTLAKEIDQMSLCGVEINCLNSKRTKSAPIEASIDQSFINLKNSLLREVGFKYASIFESKLDNQDNILTIKWLLAIKKAELVLIYLQSNNCNYLSYEKVPLTLSELKKECFFTTDGETSDDEKIIQASHYKTNFIKNQGKIKEEISSVLKGNTQVTIKDFINITKNAKAMVASALLRKEPVKAIFRRYAVSAMPTQLVHKFFQKTEKWIGTKINNVYSACSGWGAPVYVPAAKSIIGINPHLQACEGAIEGLENLKAAGVISPNCDTTIYQEPIEYFVYSEEHPKNNVQFGFICPPYFDYEKYDCAAKDSMQSIVMSEVKAEQGETKKAQYLRHYQAWLNNYVDSTALSYSLALEPEGRGVVWVVIPIRMICLETITLFIAKDFITYFEKHGLIPFCSKKMNDNQVALAFSRGHPPLNHNHYHMGLINTIKINEVNTINKVVGKKRTHPEMGQTEFIEQPSDCGDIFNFFNKVADVITLKRLKFRTCLAAMNLFNHAPALTSLESITNHWKALIAKDPMITEKFRYYGLARIDEFTKDQNTKLFIISVLSNTLEFDALNKSNQIAILDLNYKEYINIFINFVTDQGTFSNCEIGFIIVNKNYQQCSR